MAHNTPTARGSAQPDRGITQMTKITLPIIRSSFCANGVRSGTRLFVYDCGNKFLVASNFQNVGYRRKIEDALALFERTLLGV